MKMLTFFFILSTLASSVLAQETISKADFLKLLESAKKAQTTFTSGEHFVVKSMISLPNNACLFQRLEHTTILKFFTQEDRLYSLHEKSYSLKKGSEEDCSSLLRVLNEREGGKKVVYEKGDLGSYNRFLQRLRDGRPGDEEIVSIFEQVSAENKVLIQTTLPNVFTAHTHYRLDYPHRFAMVFNQAKGIVSEQILFSVEIHKSENNPPNLVKLFEKVKELEVYEEVILEKTSPNMIGTKTETHYRPSGMKFGEIFSDLLE